MIDYFEKLMDIVFDFFNDDEERVKLWFHTPNPLIGGLTPIEMAVKRPKKTYEIFYNSYKQNEFSEMK